MFAILRFLWHATKGSRLMPWRSPYLRWRMETFTGVKASEIDFKKFVELTWDDRREFMSYLQWVAEQDHEARVAARRH